MTTSHPAPKSASQPDPGVAAPLRTIHVAVGDDQSVHVRGASPAQVVDLLGSRGDIVVVDGGSHPADRGGLVDRGGLADREIDIVTLVASGLSNQDIAGRLYLSVNTVKSYIRSAYRKMDVATRSQAVIWAVAHGLVHPERDEPHGD